MKYNLIAYQGFREFVNTESFRIQKDNISGFNYLLDDDDHRYNCQENIDLDLPHYFYFEQNSHLSEAKLINTIPLPVPYKNFISINFTNKYLNQENSEVLQINLNISPSSCLGSVEVKEILEEYNSISSNLIRRNYEEWEGRRIKNIDLNYILKFKNNENHLSIHEIIKKSNSFNIIHWATTNLPWFYYDYDIIYCEGLSIKNLIEKYGNDITNDKLKNIIKISEMKAQFFLSYQCPQYNEQDRIDHYEHLQWLKDIKNDWMDNESDYWNID